MRGRVQAVIIVAALGLIALAGMTATRPTATIPASPAHDDASRSLDEGLHREGVNSARPGVLRPALGPGPATQNALIRESRRTQAPVTIRVWHSFRDREKLALQTVATVFNLESTSGTRIELVDCDDENFTSRLERAIQAGAGPDVFFWAHDKTGEWVERGIVRPVEVVETSAYLPNCLAAMQYDGRVRGLPLAFETLILYYNRNLVPEPPASTEALLALAAPLRAKGAWPLVYDRANFYLHAMWLHGFGGRVFDAEGGFDALSQPMLRSLSFARDLAAVHDAVPDTVDWDLQIQLFNSGRAGMLISGPWAWGSLDRDSIPVGLAVLPYLAEAGCASMPFLGVKGAFVSAKTRHPEAAAEVAAALTSGYAGTVFHILAGDLPAQAGAYRNAVVAADRRTDVFKEQSVWSVPMPSVPAMARVWKVMMTEAGTMRHGCLDRVFLDRESPEEAARKAMAEFRGGARTSPPTAGRPLVREPRS